MIAANKNLLKATLTQGVLGIQTELISLYASNLSAIATQAALIAGFSFTAVIAVAETSTVSIVADDSIGRDILQYFYYILFTICFIAALCILAQATLVVTLGPSMALKGTSNESVKNAASHMFRQMLMIYNIASIAITCLFMGTCIICWSNYPVGVAAIATCCYIIGYFFIVYQTGNVFRLFEDAFIDSFDQSEGNGAPIRTLMGGKTYKPTENANEEAIQKANESIEATKLKARGIIWKRQPVEEGGLHVKCYAVLERGLVDFFKSSKDFKDGKNPINKKPLKLWEVDVETDPRKYSKKVTSVRNTFSSALVGNEDFALSDLMSSEHDLKYAAKNFKFALVPKVASELAATTIIEFIAHDETSYNLWVEAFTTVTKAYDSLAANASVEQTMRSGTSDVESVVLAANNSA